MLGWLDIRLLNKGPRTWLARAGDRLRRIGDSIPRAEIPPKLGFGLLFALLSAISLIPLWSVRIPPMQDLWQHLALVDVIHAYDDPGSVYADYFLLPTAPKPNLVYYYLTHLLAYLAPLEVANKLVLSLYVVAFPASFLYLLASFGRSRRLALFAFPLVYNSMFGYGFVSFILALPILFLTLGTYRRFVAPRGPGLNLALGAAAGVLLALVYFTHLHVFLLAALLCFLLLVMHRDGFWGTLLRAAPFAPALVFFVPWFVVYFVERTPSSSGMTFGAVGKFFGPTYYKPSRILGSFFHYVGDYFRDESDDFLFVLLMLVALTLLMFRRAPDVPEGARRKVGWFDLEVLTVAVAVTVLVLPQHIEAQAIVSARHIPIALLFFFGWLGADQAPRRIVFPALTILVVVHILWLGNLVRGFRAFERELDGYPALFERVEGGTRLLKVNYGQESNVVNHGALWHTHFFFMLEKGGVSDVQFAEYPHNPVQYRRGMVPPLPGPDFYNSPAWRYFEYVMVRKSTSPALRPVQDSLDPVADVADWALYRVRPGPVPRPPDDQAVAKGRRKELDVLGVQPPGVSRGAIHDAVHARPGPRVPVLRRGIVEPLLRAGHGASRPAGRDR